MGYMRHHAIVVTAWSQERILKAHNEATGLGMSVSNITDKVTNGYRSFLVAPDGSKEGWDTSDVGDTARLLFIGWLDEQRYDDGSSPFGWVEVQYDDDEQETRVTAHSDQPRRIERAQVGDQ